MDSILDPITEIEEDKFCVEMMKRLDIQRRNEQFCDVILEAGSGDDQASLKAHRIVLCAASPFFHNALNSDMKEKKEGVIRLEETSKAVMEEVLEYVYTGHVDINEHNAFDLLAAADYFLIPSLKSLCCNAILQALSFSNSITAYYFAVKYRCEELLKHARDFILANFLAVASTEDFLNLSLSQVEEWISSDEIIVNEEEEVFEVLAKWMERNESKKESFYDLFRHIRCIYVHRDYLLNVILLNLFVKNDSECTTFALDAMKMVFRGQEECYFAQSPRNCLKTHEDAIVACGGRSTLCYIPSENKWYKLADMKSARIFHSHAMSSCHRKVFFVGGSRNGCAAEFYDPLLNTWFPLKSFQRTIIFCSVVTFQGLLYVIGGVDKDGNRLSTVQRYNPDANVWQAVPSLSSSRSTVCAVASESHLYAIGGISGVGYVDIAERFDPKERAWSRIASTLKKRGGAGGAAANQKVFVFGGHGIEALLDSCEMYDPVTDVWSIIADTVVPARASVASFKGKIVVCGCFEQDEENLSLKVYNTVSNEWTSCSSVPIGIEKPKISSLRMPREVLATCEVLS